MINVMELQVIDVVISKKEMVEEKEMGNVLKKKMSEVEEKFVEERNKNFGKIIEIRMKNKKYDEKRRK